MEVIAAAISAIGAIVAALAAASAHTKARENARLEQKIDAESRDRAKLESEIWRQFRELPEGHPTRREYDRLEGMVDDVRQEMRGIRSDLKTDTASILKAIREAQVR